MTPDPGRPLSPTASLGVVGWTHLDPLLIAALALEAPLLLVGPHGTAKTFLVERIAEALDAEFRHYNASLLNYDDLVGIPLPDADGERLRFVGTPGAIWGTEFVFFDEVNRCRPDLQNKMFPLVHERRVAGVDVTELRHRWAAMNPPGIASDSFDGGYLGAEPLDAALADRFWFVVRVPSWQDLSREERAQVVSGGIAAPHPGLQLAALVDATRARAAATDQALTTVVTRYVVLLADLLDGVGAAISARRAHALARSIIATFAAAGVLGRVDGERQDWSGLESLAELVVLNGLPHWCDPSPPSVGAVVAAHVQAWQTSVDELDEVRRALLAETDAVHRLRLGIELDADDATLGTLALGALSALETRAERMGLATVLTRRLADRRLTPAAWSVIAETAAPVLRPGTTSDSLPGGTRLEAWRQASAHLVTLEDEDGVPALEYALLNAAGATALAEVDLDELLRSFRTHCDLFEVAA